MDNEKMDSSVPVEQVGASGTEDTMVTAPTADTAVEKQRTTATAEETNDCEPAGPQTDENRQGVAVDFSDEEAALAASAPEFELEENADEQNASDKEDGTAARTADYTGKTKEELVAEFARLLDACPVQTLRADVEAIKVAFYKTYRNETEQRRKAFLEAGGAAEEFVAPADEQEQRFKSLFAEYRRKRNEFIAQTDAEKEENYKAKLQIIDELKELIGSNETLNHTFNAFRELQRRWKETGPVPQTHVKDLWETYNLHVENFYNFIKIDKELRDMDLKKNYEAKLRLCEEAEALVLESSVITAFHKLQKLHEQWREIGPVANEYKEQLWDRFRMASSKINKRHQEYFDNVKEEQKRNLDLKTELCVKTEELVSVPPATRKEWNKASDRLIEIQKVWKTIGFAPKKDNTRIYERFRNACDKFFENKRAFYLRTKTEMEDNLRLKNEICAAAEALSESDEWKKTTDELIALQKKWKEIGPVSRRHSDAVWKRFRAACDRFFERKSAHFSAIDSQYEENLAKKRQLLEELRNFAVEEREKGFEALKELQRRWSETGFVPIKQKEAVQNEYRKLVDDIFARLRGSERERHLERFRGKITSMASEGGNDRRMRHERDRLYNKLKQLEADVALLENNIGFFAKSKNAEAMIRDVNEKITRSREEMATLVEKINLIDKQGE
ncbi:DUF349 domain-containing protein [uncultured Alistipes sp.]|uniref:DUF349 domain-containing protein n=1 Tax=uncultured Alistipes sp. TaxID=538949 RepID=UPI002636BB30|nr:DUF349 domain-containing protein [uncultured Alistipes sp.]